MGQLTASMHRHQTLPASPFKQQGSTLSFYDVVLGVSVHPGGSATPSLGGKPGRPQDVQLTLMRG